MTNAPVVDQLTDMICDSKDAEEWNHNYNIVWNLLVAAMGSDIQHFEEVFLTDMASRRTKFIGR